MDVTVRGLRPEEWRTYRTVRLAALRDAPDAFGGSYAASAAYPESLWRQWCGEPSWFAFVDDEPVGMVRVADQVPGALPELISMWVAPPARGGGAAQALVDAVLGWAREQGCPGVRLAVFEGNPRARRFYEGTGFRASGERTVLPDGRVELGLERRWQAQG